MSCLSIMDTMSIAFVLLTTSPKCPLKIASFHSDERGLFGPDLRCLKNGHKNVFISTLVVAIASQRKENC